MMTKMEIQTLQDQQEDGESSSRKEGLSRSGANRWLAPLPSLPSCPAWWQLAHSRKQSKNRAIPKPTDKNQNVCENNSFSRTIRLPVLPHTALVSEILPFCDDSTLMAFRGVSRVFRDLEIPREFHHRAMRKIDLTKESSRRKRKQRQQKPLSTSIPEGVRYSYKRKVLDEEQRKVWVFLRDMIGERQRQFLPEATTADCHSDLWSLQTVTSKVLKLIQDIEFYNGCVYGYDQERARKLLLEKGCIDDSDFAQPQKSLKKLFKTNLYGKHHENEYPVYGKWRAEASVREVSLNEALEILSDNASINRGVCKTQWRWRIPLRKRKDKQSSNHKHHDQKTIRSGAVDEKLGFSLLLAAKGDNRSLVDDWDCSSGIRLAEYSTVFDKTKMSCSILLVQTLGGAEAEVRVLSGRVEPPSKRLWRFFQSQPSGKGLTISRHSNSTVNLSLRSI